MTKDEVLKLALEAWQTSVYGSKSHHKAMLFAMTAIKQARSAPVQEPVAWVEKNGDLVWQNYEAAIGRNLYTTPPAQEFVCSTGLCHYKATSEKRECMNCAAFGECNPNNDAAPMQEPWKSSDTAHRPGGLPQDFIKHEVENESDWSEWVNPYSEQYFMKCCDCGLVHEMQFKVAKYSEGDECEFVADANLQAVFRARRATLPEAPVQEPVAWIEHHKGGDNLEWENPGGKCTPLYTTPTTQPAPVQEPVAWAWRAFDPDDGHFGKWGTWHISGYKPPRQQSRWFQVVPLPNTTPPAAQRQWVGLTVLEQADCFANTEDATEFYHAIEAKLKEKNT